VEVSGSLGPAQPDRAYEVPYDPKTTGLFVEVKWATGTSAFAGQLTVMDESGRLLSGPISTTNSSPLLLYIPAARMEPSVPLIVRISSLTSLGKNSVHSAALTEQFLLDVVREPSSSASTTTEGSGNNDPNWMGSVVNQLGASASSEGPSNASGSTVSLALNSNSTTTEMAAGVTGTVVSGVVPQVASLATVTGPLPSRSAGPLGGILTTEEAVPQVGPRAVARVELDRLELLLDEVIAEQRPDHNRVRQDVQGGGLVTVLGPGGVPLLASGNGDGVVVDSNASGTAVWPLLLAPALAPENILTGERRALDRKDAPDAALRGVSVALAFVFSLFGPELVYRLRHEPKTRRRLRLGWLRRGGRRCRIHTE
jgi:hypothetical protein